MKAKYYNKPENVLFYDLITRFLARIFGAKYFAIKCRVCGKIPAEIYGDTCLDHKDKERQVCDNGKYKESNFTINK